MTRTAIGRKLAAVMFTDIVGYSSIAESDEKLALDLVSEHQRILRKIFPSFGGVEINTTGDGFFCEFPSVVEAVHCAIAIQTTLFERNLSMPEDRKLQIRIGLHLGDVLDRQQDRFGSEVNVAARIEPFAQPGGICISQQVMDHVASRIEFPVRKLGKLRVKNINAPLTLYRIVMPWETHQKFSFRWFSQKLEFAFPKTFSGGFLAAQLIGVLAVMGCVLFKVGSAPSLKVDSGPTRSIASTSGVRETVLPESWEYSRASESEASTRWSSFDTANNTAYADELNGDYLLRLKFTGAGGFRHPALTMGLISDASRVYLNGNYIGGSERFSDVGVYSFDPRLIHPGEENTILIKAHTRPTFSPGLNLLSGLEPKIGEFENIQKEVNQRDFSYRVVRPVALAISLFLAFACLFYGVIRREGLKYLYYSSFLFLGGLCLAYYNPFVTASLGFQFYRFIKALSLALSSAVLFSAYLNGRGLRRLETVNGFFALSAMPAISWILLSREIQPSQYLVRYHGILLATIAYTGTWLGILAVRGIYKISKPIRLHSITPSQVAHVTLISGFGLVIAFLCFVTVTRTTAFKDLALLYPFAFAIAVMGMAVADYTRKSHDLGQKRRKDDLILNIAHVVATGAEISQTIAAIQNHVTEFVKARRSTIYLWSESEKSGTLVANYIHGPVGTAGRVKKLIENPSGIIGYCIEHRSPIFVEDIRKDSRFRGMSESQSDFAPGFQNGSFMVFPLILGTRLLGVITVSDRQDGQAFSRDDFCLMHLVAKDLALLLNQPQVQEKLDSRAA